MPKNNKNTTLGTFEPILVHDWKRSADEKLIKVPPNAGDTPSSTNTSTIITIAAAIIIIIF